MSQLLLLQPYRLGRITLCSRVVMAPMTRNRALGNVPNELLTSYYDQRASAGLIISEGISPSPNGLGAARIPGIFNQAQVAAWRQVTDAVHAKGGHMFAQFMHTGRVSHQNNLPAGATVLAPSAIALPADVYVDGQGNLPPTLPTAMNEAQIEATLEEYAQAAANAVEAGFDGVELHGANGYLIDQFLNAASNVRTDRWGGSVENRIRFALEAVKRSVARIGADRVAIRLSPYGVFNGMNTDADTDALYTTLAAELGKLGLAYVHLADHSSMGAPAVPASIKAAIRKGFGGTIILCGGFDGHSAEAELRAGRADLIGFGRAFIANPNLVAKLEQDAALVPPDFATFYTPGPQGYTDYAG